MMKHLLLTILCLITAASAHDYHIGAGHDTTLPIFFMTPDIPKLIGDIQRTAADITQRLKQFEKQRASIDEQSAKIESEIANLLQEDAGLIDTIRKNRRIIASLENNPAQLIEEMNQNRTNTKTKFNNANSTYFETPVVSLEQINMDTLHEKLQLPERLKNAKKWMIEHESKESSSAHVKYWAELLKEFGEFCVLDDDARKEILYLLDRLDGCKHEIWMSQARRLRIRLEIQEARSLVWSLEGDREILTLDIERDKKLLAALDDLLAYAQRKKSG